MTTDYHSIWLMPRREDEEAFSKIVQDLSGRFGGPMFQPHLTLVEDMPRSCDELRPLMQELASDAASFHASVEAIEASPLYFRSFYARFSAVAPLRALKEKAVGLFGVGSLETFMPHISLAYGIPDSSAKAEAMAVLHRQLHGWSVIFDRVHVVSSSQHTPIKDWKMKAACRLS